jgi:photosynthetic reaction center cytochrome c subunit
MNKKSVAMPALAATAAAALFLAGAAFTTRASAQTPAPKKTAPAATKSAATSTSAEKKAGEAFKNVTTPTLKALTVADFMGAMGVISADLGLDCADCHPGAGSDKADFVIDTPQKITTRKMVNMVAAINKENFGGVQNVTCWTCHHGKEKPATTITLDKLYGTPNDEKDDIITQGEGEPTGAQVLDKYIAAVGGAQKLAGLKSWVATGKSEGYEGLGGGGTFTVYAKAPDQKAQVIIFKDHPERGDTYRVYNCKTGWNKTPRNAVPEYELSGSELDGMRFDALIAFPGNVKTALTNMHTMTTELGDKDVELVQGFGPNALVISLYFDKKTNLLVRMVRYSRTPVGRVPTQIDYDDYREVDGIKFPFSYTFSWLDGRDQFKINKVEVNVPIDASKFAKP